MIKMNITDKLAFYLLFLEPDTWKHLDATDIHLTYHGE